MKIIDVAKKYVGYDYRHFCSQFGGGCWPWCAATISVFGKESGSNFPWSTSCNDQIAWFKQHDMWMGMTKDIRVGDVIYYDWDKITEAKPADHVGIVSDVSGSNITVIEGNFGNADNDETTVSTRKITANYPYIFGIARPKYDDVVEANSDKRANILVRQLEESCVGKDVEALQILLSGRGYSVGHCGVDGDFGGDTDKAVKQYQKDNGLTSDGIVGPQTWSRLLTD